MTAERVIVRKNTYFDSVSLMVASQTVDGRDDVELATAIQSTALNVGLLEAQGFVLPSDLSPNDLVIAVRARDDEALEDVLLQIDLLLVNEPSDSGALDRRVIRSWREMKRQEPSASLGIIAVPGRHAAVEGAAALEAGLDVFCFSDGVAVEHEVALKTWAVSNDRLFMGPDCGTAIIGGVGLGFANRVEAGPVGVIGASGTGTQEVCALLDRAGVGISHAVGVGSRDLTADVGGLMTLHALELLEDDDSTEAVIIVSKPPDPGVAERVFERASSLEKPVALAFLGTGFDGKSDGLVSPSIEKAVARTCRSLGRSVPETPEAMLPSANGDVRGFFCGGTLCYQTQLVMHDAGISVRSNVPLDPTLALADPWTSKGHTFIDFGEDAFTDGRLHPMIDPSLRDERIKEEAKDPDIGIIVCDVVLGDGAHPDPASELADSIEAIDRQDIHFVTILCGTSRDPQDVERQAARLTDARVAVVRSSEAAGRSVVAALGATS